MEEGVELALRIGQLQVEHLVARRLGAIRRYLVATPTYLYGCPLPRTPEDLSCRPLHRLPDFPAAHEWTFESGTWPSCRADPCAVLIDDADAMEEAVRSISAWRSCRSGVRSVASAAESWSIFCPTIPPPHLPLHAVYPDMLWMSLRARPFLDLLIKRADLFTARP